MWLESNVDTPRSNTSASVPNLLSNPHMKNCTAHSGYFLIIAAILICVCSRPASAQEAVSATATSTSSSSSATAASPTTPSSVPEEQTGAGIFARPPLKISVSARTGYDDNVTTFNVDKQGSGYTTGSIALDYELGRPRTQLTLEAAVSLTYFWEHIRSVGVENNDYDIATHLRLALTHHASTRLNLSTQVYLSYQTEPDFTLTQGLNRRTGNFFVTNDRFAVEYFWTPRFSTQTSYSLSLINYDDEAIGQFDDRFNNTFANEFRYLVVPSTTLVADYRFQVISYIHESSRDSTGHYLLAGLDHKFDPRFSGTFRAGVQFRDFDQGDGRSSPYFEGSLDYVLGKQTAVTWTNRYAIEEPDDAISQSRTTFRTGLIARHDFTPRIRGSVNGYYEHSEYESPGSSIGGFTEDTFDLGLSLRYSITRYLGVEGGYNFTEVSSDGILREYSRNRYWAGVNFTF